MRIRRDDVIHRMLDDARAYHYKTRYGFILPTKNGGTLIIMVLLETIEVHYKGNVIVVCEGTPDIQLYCFGEFFQMIVDDVLTFRTYDE